MKKFILLFILLTGLKSANAQLEFYQFMFNIYENNERITDSRRFAATLNVYDRQNPDSLVFTLPIQIGDTAKNLGYDYNILHAGDLIFYRTPEIILTQGTDSMRIIFDNPKASAWTSIGFDKLVFKKGIYKFTEETWPAAVRDRPLNNRNFNFIDENFDWEKVRQK